MMKRAILVLFVAGLCVGCDQVTKGIAREGLDDGRAISYMGDVLRLQLAENHGGMLSFGSSLSGEHRFLILTVFVAVALIGFFLFALLTKKMTTLQIISISFVLGGGLGNLIDRLLNDGAVIDFLVIGIGSVRTAVFNLADVAILLGAVVLLVARGKPSSPIDPILPQHQGP